MYHSPIAILLILSAAATGAFALWKGDLAAQIAGVASALSAIVLPAARMMLQSQVGEAVQLSADFVWAVGLLLLAVRFASLWLGVTMLLQSAQFSLHAYYLVMDRPHDLLHAWINNLNTLGISICVLVGALLAIRRRKMLAREEAEREARRQKLLGGA